MKNLSLTSVRSLHRWIGRSFIFLLLGLVVTLGCTTMVTPLNVTPLKPGGGTSVEAPDHGYVLGRVHLRWNGKPQTVAQSRFTMKWSLTEEKSGAKLVVDQVPFDGPFVLNLPAGTYRLTAVGFDNVFGVWRTPLPTSFNVRSQQSTYVGTWDLTMQTKFFTGTLTRQVRDQEDQAETDMRTIMGDRVWPPLVAELGEPGQSPMVLTRQTQGTQLTSPP